MVFQDDVWNKYKIFSLNYLHSECKTVFHKSASAEIHEISVNKFNYNFTFEDTETFFERLRNKVFDGNS